MRSCGSSRAIPGRVLQTVSQQSIGQALADSDFSAEVDKVVRERRAALSSPAWFDVNHPGSALTQGRVLQHGVHAQRGVAHLLRWAGKCRGRPAQIRERSGRAGGRRGGCSINRVTSARSSIASAASRPCSVQLPGAVAITPLRTATGEWLRLKVELPGFPVWLRTWQAQVGRVRLLLLDSNDTMNFPAWRGITSELYGGGPEMRLRQELILGIGGWRLLTALGIHPQVCHLNEGHAAFAVLERARAWMQQSGQGFRRSAGDDACRQSVHDAHGRCRRFRPFSRRNSLNSTWASTPGAHWASVPRNSWRWGEPTRRTGPRPSTWRTWRSAAAGAVSGVQPTAWPSEPGRSSAVFSRAGPRTRSR